MVLYKPSIMQCAVPPSAAPDFRAYAPELSARARNWTQSAVFAREWAQGTALYSVRGLRSFAQLHAAANRLAHHLRALGLRPGDAVALMCRNRPEFVEVLLAALRIGSRLTPVATALTGDEAAYIVRDCQARVLFVEAGLAGEAIEDVHRIVIGTPSYDAALDGGSPQELAAPEAGSLMLYTSGTTGRPKGVFSRRPDHVEPQFAGSFADYRPGDVQLCAGPAYHSAPLLFDLRWPLASGVPIVMIEKWDTHEVLRAIEQHRVTHAHMVPTMFQRLLAPPLAERAAFDLSSLRFVVHGAAPCPVATKHALIEWLGPVLTEYYAATEGGDNIHVSSADWLRKPGTVGRLDAAKGHRILDDEGGDVAPGQVGRIWLRAPAEGRFEYFGDAEKTAAAYRGDHFTLGDLGFVDGEGWLFLTGRGAETIISGGVNVYPREVDEVLGTHPAVAEVCTVGAPDPEWGERVVSVVVPAAGHAATTELAAALVEHAAQGLAGYKRPREIVFERELPHTATGKLLRGRVRERFWAGRDKAI
jgi:long-chain acyl-CoA synthetase